MAATSRSGPADSPLIGRRRELDALAAAYDDAAAGQARVVLIAGETGVGKSRLVREFVTGLGDHPALVVTGTSPVIVGGEIPFAPIGGALRDLVQRVPSQRVLELIPPESELARLLPDHSAAGAAGTDPLAQVRLFEQWLSLLVRLGSENDGGLILIVEDLHWADASTRDLLAYLIANLSIGRVLLLLTVRSEGLAGNAPLRRLLLEATRQPSVRSIDVDLLSVDEAEALVTTLGGVEASPPARLRMAERSGGNPLFAEQLVQVGSGEGFPRTMVELVRERLDRLSPDARRIAQLASTGATGLPLALLEDAARVLQLPAAPALAELREAGIVRVQEEPSNQTYVFRHPLLQEVVYAELMPAERKALHMVFADAMSRTLGNRAADSGWVLELARHRWMAGDGAGALPALIAAGDNAMESFAFNEALLLYERAIEAAAGEESPRQRRPIGFRVGGPSETHDKELSSLGERAAQAASLAGHPDRALELLDAEHRSQADPTVSMRHAEYLWQAGRQTEALGVYREALGGLPDGRPGERAALVGAAARAMLLAGLTQDAERLAAEAAESARAAGSESEELHALYTLSAAQAQLGEPKTAVETLERARELDLRRQRRTRIQPRPSRIVDLLSGYWSEAAVLGSAGRTEEAAAAALEGARTAAKLGVRGGWGGMVGVAAADELIALGRWSEAQSLLEEWLSASGLPSESAHWHAAHAYLLALRGHPAEATQHLATSQRAVGAPVEARLRAAQLRAEAEIGLVTGQASETGRSLELGLQDLGDRLAPADLVGLVALALRAAAEHAEEARARKATAELAAVQSNAVVLHGRALALGGGVAQSSGGSRLRALVTWASAEYGRVMGERDPAPWLDASEQWAALREPHRVAYMRFRAAAEDLARPGAKQDARDLLAAAHATCLELGAEPLRRNVEALARRGRIELTPAGIGSHEGSSSSDESARGSPFGLSPREAEVLELVADGRTNRQIGETLFITEKTAGHHVSSILGKLGVASRVEAASLAARAGIWNPAPPAVSVGQASATLRDADLGEHHDATLMFTDIVSSTALLEAVGDAAWLELIAWHDELLRSLFRAYSGREIDHAGDGFFVVFPDVIAALDCGVAIQRSLTEHRRKQGFAPRLRVAIHCASVVSHGPALRGRGVHEAARVAEAALGDEILVSTDSLGSVSHRYLRGEPRIVSGAGLRAPISVVPIGWRPFDESDRSGKPPISGTRRAARE